MVCVEALIFWRSSPRSRLGLRARLPFASACLKYAKKITSVSQASLNEKISRRWRSARFKCIKKVDASIIQSFQH